MSRVWRSGTPRRARRPDTAVPPPLLLVCCRGFGFVKMKRREDADVCIEKLNGFAPHHASAHAVA